ncbi:T9SS type A sorting domain-containing protein [Bizionia gelidisalsuginis]|uniref:T9SS type A sorting domain-containing protein n=2 Tax=Bizionia gelidisalsuginis TaxID=291188 RepID=A0ABY3MEZ8_9FLAO|nr:T9SS type A sorting domain-containing protein [Bizionia gelidisalsuginis]
MPLGLYAPPAGQAGSTAIAVDSNLFIDWASGATVTRGLINITDPSATYNGSNYPTVGSSDSAVGVANGDVVSLGDGGEAILTFDTPIINSSGFDFAVFENSFSDTFLELAFVEVSSDGVNFFRFPSHSQTQTTTQVGGFGNVDATYINNLAGKYRSGFGTPFDISDIADDPLLNKDGITHIKVIDVGGTIDPAYATYDSYGNIINEPFPTPFHSGGFDLNAIGVINNETLSINFFAKTEGVKIYPNPATSEFYISKAGLISIYSSEGRLVLQQNNKSAKTPIYIDRLTTGIYLVNILSDKGTVTVKLIKK